MRTLECLLLPLLLVAQGRQITSAVPFTIALSVDKPTVTKGAEVWVKVAVTNKSSLDLDDSGGFTYDGLDPNFQFEVRDKSGKSVPKRTYPHPELTTGQAVNRTIAPGETLTSDQRVSAVYDMRKPGKYIIQVSRRASDNPKDGEIKSNRITVTVLP